jgi:thioredoxin 1
MIALRPSFRRVTALTGVTRRSMSVITLSDQEAVEKFKTINSKTVCYFTAVWCPPCKQIKPIYEEMSTKYDGVAFGKIDVDDNADAAVEYEISNVPTFIAFDGEEIVARFSGADPNQLTSMVEALKSR